MQSLHQHVSLFPLLAEALHRELTGYVLKDAWRNPFRDLTLLFEKGEEQISLQFNTEAKTGLFFFYDYPLERGAGVQPLFKEIIGTPLSAVLAHPNNRSFQLDFAEDRVLVFKVYGPLSNVILFKNKQVSELYRSEIENDYHLGLDSFGSMKNKMATDFEGWFYIGFAEQDGLPILRFQAPEICLAKQNTIFEALTHFSSLYLQHWNFESSKGKILSTYKQKLKRELAICHGVKKFLDHLETATPPDEIGHILMANIHHMQKGISSIELFDFYRNKTIQIPLKKELSPQDNAANYYGKAKNRKQEITRKTQQMEMAEQKVLALQETLAQIEMATQLKDLRPWLKDQTKEKVDVPLKERFRKFERLGYTIYVGKNAQNNDLLTLQFAHKEDLWLHAKGVSGSHVIIKHKPNEAFPGPVIQAAAEIAAYYSSATGSTLVPVLYARKKYVRKPRGANPGQVKIEREELILVEPGI